MNRLNADAGEFGAAPEDYLANDEIPGTLINVLKHIAIDFMPETQAAAATINQWLADNEPAEGITAERAVGIAEFEVRGQSIKTIAQPYRFYLLQRLFAIYDEANASDKAILDELLASIDMAGLMDQRLSQSIGRANNLEIWLGNA